MRIAPLPTASVTAAPPPSGECRIVGTGERRTYGEDAYFDFEVFATRDARAASFLVAAPAAVHVTWSRFPQAGEREARAGVMFGGQKRIRFEGWASLHGRTFSVAKPMYAEPGHLWARAGAPIEMLGADADVAIARVATPFVAPKTITLRGPCESVVYTPQAPEHGEPTQIVSKGTVVNRGVTLPLFASTSSQPFTTITLENKHELMMDVIDRRDAFVRVHAVDGEIELDAWVRALDVDESDEGTIGLGGFGTSSHCGGSASYQRGVVVRDAQLFVGKTPSRLVGAFVEKDAEVRFYTGGEEATVDGHVVMAFDLDDGTFRAPDDSHFWIAKDAVARK